MSATPPRDTDPLSPEELEAIYVNSTLDGWCGHDLSGEALQAIFARIERMRSEQPHDKPCRTCAHLDPPLDVRGRRSVRKGWAYPCTAPLPPMPAIPLAYADLRGAYNSASRRFANSDQTGCPAHKPFQKG